MMFFQGITVYPDRAGHWRFVLASGDRCVTHPLQFRSEEQALRIARASFAQLPARVIQFCCRKPALASVADAALDQ
jgi:hypothetical protein